MDKPFGLEAQPAQLVAQVIVRDKDGNVKYAGPLVLTPLGDSDGRNPQHSGS